MSVAVDCTPAALQAALAGHVGELAERDGALLAVFESVGAALHAAVLAQQRAREGRAPRIGVSHGGVVRRDGELTGPATAEALELSRQAQRGEVLVGEVVRVLAGAGHAFQRRIAGADQHAAWRLVLDPLAGVPLPHALRPDRGRWPFVGRERELAAIRDQLATLGSGDRSAFLLAGEPGIGKTRLAAEAAVAAHVAGAVVLYGRSDEGVGIPYQPFAEALAHYVEHSPAGTEIPSAGARELAALVPVLDQRLAPDERPPGVAGERYLLFAAIASLLTAASEQAPLLLVLDDLQWADEPTVLLLRHLLMAPGPLRLLVLAGYRPDNAQGQGSANALAELRRDERVHEFPLAGLEHEQIAAFVEEAAGGTLDERERAFAGALHRDTGGNPLFAGELLRSLGDRAALRRAAGELASADTLPAPPTVRELIAARAARLGPDVEEVLGAAAVIGREFDLDALGAVAELQAADAGTLATRLATAVDSAVAAKLIVPAGDWPGRFTFRHALIRTTLYEQQGAARRGLLHRRVAEDLERRVETRPGPRAAALAHHWREAAPPDPERALRWAELAGRHALDQLEPHAAIRWHTRALQLHEAAGASEDRRRAELLIGLGTARRQRGDAGFRETLLDAARLAQRLGETELVVAAALANTRGFVSASGVVDEERIAILRTALEAVGTGDSRERALLLATLASELSFAPGFERRKALSDEAVALARRLGDPPTLCQVLSARFVPVWIPETLDERLEGADESVRIADQLGDPLAQFKAIHWHGVALVQAARMEEARRAVEREKALAARLGEPTARWLACYDDANLAIVAGRLDAAERLAGEALALGLESGQPDARSFHATQLMNVRHEQGRLAELQPMIAATVRDNPGIPAFRALLALACVEGELRERAAELLLAESLAELPHDVTWLAGHVIWAHVCVGVGDADRAEALYERLEAYGAQIAYTGISAWGDVDHALGRLATLLGRYEEAERRLAASSERYRRAGAPIWLARAALDEAALRLERGAPGDAERARALLETAQAEGRRLGAAQIERRAESLGKHERAAAVLAVLPHARAAAAAGHGAAAADRPKRAGAERVRRAELRRSGQVWTLRSAAGEFHFNDTKGLRYLARLLGEPRAEVHVLELTSAPAEPVPAGGVAELSLASEHAGALLDREAKRAYRVRLEDLEHEIAEAERFNDPERGAQARAEHAAIVEELAAAVGLGGRDRVAASAAERARVNATRAIRKAIGRIEAEDPSLGGHLDRAVRTGTFCAYDPGPQDELRWELEL